MYQGIIQSNDIKEYLIALGNEIRSCYDVHKDKNSLEQLQNLIGEDIGRALSITAQDHFDPYWR